MNLQTAIILFFEIIIFALYTFVEIKKKGLRKIVINYICLAEKSFENHKNDEKFNYVLTKFYDSLPNFLKFFVSESMIKYFIQCVFDEIKNALDTRAVGK